jgi:hypothetical protein
VLEHGLVEVDAAEALDALGLAEDVQPATRLRSRATSKVPPPRS